MIIVGLGNPGQEYSSTRHNTGFMVLDKLRLKLNAPDWQTEKGVAWTKTEAHWLVKPMKLMNHSGPALADFLDYKHLDLAALENKLVIVHDDVDFPLGAIHRQSGRSAAGHQGVQSVIDTLGTKNFVRLRIGIGDNRPQNIPAEAYVLQAFTAAERELISPAIDQAVAILDKLLSQEKTAKL